MYYMLNCHRNLIWEIRQILLFRYWVRKRIQFAQYFVEVFESGPNISVIKTKWSEDTMECIM